ncbi:hypothetical protein [Sandaracinus amylolyticus]|uniref:hypothetical protein n=1 Tax=Sandaracinus amylolyticus TaxID=927083 RepID=UPI001F1AE411|nr:hypothetical protein [Sandaracinus amylolyticus]UJR84781.1 Hypothetical protein I5071_68600 [Sandaracinus amylolyticus]
MIGAIELRCAHYLLAVGAEDLELHDDGTSTWRALFALLADGTRVIVRGSLGEREIAELGTRIDELLRGERAAVSFLTGDGTLYVALERRKGDELGLFVRLVSDASRGAYSCAETRASRARVAQLARDALGFPYG